MSFKMFSCGSNAGMETSAPLVSVIVNKALFHSNSYIHQRPPQIVHSLHFLLVNSLPQIL